MAFAPGYVLGAAPASRLVMKKSAGRFVSRIPEEQLPNREGTMNARGRPIYREWSPWPGWIQIVFWGSLVLGMVAVLESPDMPGRLRLASVTFMAAAGALVQWLVAGLTVRLYRDEMKVGLGSAAAIAKRIRYDDILRTESVRYSPLREFGGWGVRFRGKKRAWTARGHRAVVLHLADGIQLYVGSDRPYALEERIRTVGGRRIGSRETDSGASGVRPTGS